jgi:hypothetical protein
LTRTWRAYRHAARASQSADTINENGAAVLRRR